MPHEEIQWFNYNIPREQWTTECPEALADLSDKDRRIIGSWDEEYRPMSWDTVRTLVSTNAIDQFQRSPLQLRRYRQYVYHLQKEYGSVMKYIINHCLRWGNATPSGPPFSNPEDVKVLYNDWPYGVDNRIVHLVVWVKFELEEDPITGLSTAESAQQIEAYVDRTFRTRVHPDNVVWFKNWKSLKSVHAVEHFHVMLFDPDMAFVRTVTNGHVPMNTVLRGAGLPMVVPGNL